jgi:NAD(P)-dependent dehydrogenase (short-subunit alcohol dehydrogenase family)
MAEQKTRWVLITGTSTGIGRALALKLANDGFGVFAGVRRQEHTDDLSAEFAKSKSASTSTGQLVPLILDVTDPKSIVSALENIKPRGLWALINNAGIVVPGPVEHLSMEQWRHQFDVNFFGLIDLTRQTIPLLRQSVATFGVGSPRLLIISSIGGRVAQPIISAYTASKWATTALGDSLRLELHRQGIGVTVIEPGAIATAIWGKGEKKASEFGPDHPARKNYGLELDSVTELSNRTAAKALAPDKAADVIVAALTARRAPARVLVGTDAKMAAFFKRWLPTTWFDAILKREFGINNPRADAATA